MKYYGLREPQGKEVKDANTISYVSSEVIEGLVYEKLISALVETTNNINSGHLEIEKANMEEFETLKTELYTAQENGFKIIKEELKENTENNLQLFKDELEQIKQEKNELQVLNQDNALAVLEQVSKKKEKKSMSFFDVLLMQGLLACFVLLGLSFFSKVELGFIESAIEYITRLFGGGSNAQTELSAFFDNIISIVTNP